MRIGINCGHTISGAGSGAIGILNESVETRNVGNELMRILKERGVEVVDCTVNTAPTQAVYLSNVVRMANDTSLDYFISIHFNAAVNATANGTEVYTYNGEQIVQAVAIEKALSNIGFRSRGVKSGTGLYVVSKTKALAMLIEVCFVNGADAEVYKKLGAEVVAKQIANVFIAETANKIERKQGWHKEDAGLWYYYKDGGRHYGWVEDNGFWYWLQPYMVFNNWIYDKADSKWYFLNSDGKMIVNDWTYWKDKWYYLGDTGAMLTDTVTPNGFIVGCDGAWVE